MGLFKNVNWLGKKCKKAFIYLFFFFSNSCILFETIRVLKVYIFKFLL